MSRKQKGLGRGLSALIPTEDLEGAFSETLTDVKKVPISSVRANLRQPRKDFDQEKIRQLSKSISEHGIIQPLVVVRKDGEYLIVAGERRYRAAIMAGLSEIPVIIREYSPREIDEISLIENIQREDLNEVEKAEAYSALKEEYGMTQEEIAERIGTSRAAVANTLRILSLDEKSRKALVDGIITAGHARAILSVREDRRDEFLDRIIADGLSVRKSEEISAEYDRKKPKKKRQGKKKAEDPYIKDLEERLSMRLGTKVSVKDSGMKGSIVVRYYSNEELERILELLKVEE